MQKIQFKRNIGLCFGCGEKFGIGHQGKMSHLNFSLSTEDDEESEFEDDVGEQDEHIGNPSQATDKSLHALSDAM